MTRKEKWTAVSVFGLMLTLIVLLFRGCNPEPPGTPHFETPTVQPGAGQATTPARMPFTTEAAVGPAFAEIQTRRAVASATGGVCWRSGEFTGDLQQFDSCLIRFCSRIG